jgi:polysaccharide deacetylase family protein (PEP-CTERM system associated)
MVISDPPGARETPLKKYDSRGLSFKSYLDTEKEWVRRDGGRTRQGTLNGFSVDVEDWGQSSVNPDLPLTDRFYRNTVRILELLAAHETKATFFMLGLAAEKVPRLVREIERESHEVQCHGYGHRLAFQQTREQFRQDIDRSKKLIEDLSGRQVTGYRAPAFSITSESLWALDELASAGFLYDSSIFPAKTCRYGIAGAFRYPYKIRTPAGAELIEFPVASIRFLGRTWPAGGGGWLRVFPNGLTRGAISQLNQIDQPAVVYIHPHDLDPEEFQQLSFPVPWRRRVQQSWGRRSVLGKMENLLRTFRFGRIADVMDGLPRTQIRGNKTL